MKKLVTRANALNVLVVVFFIVVVVNPQAKAFILQGLMKIGLFKPPIANTEPAAPAAPALSFIDTTGKTINTAEHKGKVLFINLWATWCPPCIAEMPSVNELYKHYRNNPDIIILTVDVDNDFGRSAAFMNKKRYQLPVYQLNSSMPQSLFSGSIPTTIIIDKAGAVVARHEGAANYADERFYKYLDGLIGKK